MMQLIAYEFYSFVTLQSDGSLQPWQEVLLKFYNNSVSTNNLVRAFLHTYTSHSRVAFGLVLTVVCVYVC
jgi:hypothetical protein